MNPMWAEEMRDLVTLFIRRGKIKMPPPKTAEQVLAEHQSWQREYEKAKKRKQRERKKCLA